ncbi:MAG: hypothetical protein SF069_14200 [Phycisphaerae bacterium]|nr:hypothetical protein [Phycisphaerae bacterium]
MTCLVWGGSSAVLAEEPASAPASQPAAIGRTGAGPTELVTSAEGPSGADAVVREFFAATKAELTAIRDHDAAAAKAARKRLLESAISVDALAPQARAKLGNLSDADLAAGLGQLVDRWQALVAYYIDGVQLDNIAWHRVARGGLPAELNAVEALVPAEARGRRVTLDIVLVEVKPGAWRLQRVTYLNPAVRLRGAAASQPGSPG